MFEEVSAVHKKIDTKTTEYYSPNNSRNSTAHITHPYTPSHSKCFALCVNFSFKRRIVSRPKNSARKCVTRILYWRSIINRQREARRKALRSYGRRRRNNVVRIHIFYRPIYYNRKYGRESQQSGAPTTREDWIEGPRPATADESSKSTRCVLSRELYISIFHSHLLPPYFIAFFECDLSRNNFFLFRCRRRRAGRDLNVYQERNEAFRVKRAYEIRLLPVRGT